MFKFLSLATLLSALISFINCNGQLPITDAEIDTKIKSLFNTELYTDSEISLSSNFLTFYNLIWAKSKGNINVSTNPFTNSIDSSITVQFYYTKNDTIPIAAYKGTFQDGKANGNGILAKKAGFKRDSIIYREGKWKDGIFCNEKLADSLLRSSLSYFSPWEIFDIPRSVHPDMFVIRAAFKPDLLNLDQENSFLFHMFVSWKAEKSGFYWYNAKMLGDDFLSEPKITFYDGQAEMKSRFERYDYLHELSENYKAREEEKKKKSQFGGTLIDDYTLIKKKGRFVGGVCFDEQKNEQYKYSQPVREVGKKDVEVLFRTSIDSTWRSAGIWNINAEYTCDGTTYFTNTTNGLGPIGNGVIVQALMRPHFKHEADAIDDIVNDARNFQPEIILEAARLDTQIYLNKISSILYRCSINSFLKYNAKDYLQGSWYSVKSNSIYNVYLNSMVKILSLNYADIINLEVFDFSVQLGSIENKSPLKFKLTIENTEQSKLLLKAPTSNSILFTDSDTWIRINDPNAIIPYIKKSMGKQ